MKTISQAPYQRAAKVIPDGVTNPVRFFDPHQLYAKKPCGSKLVDFEDRLYSDL